MSSTSAKLFQSIDVGDVTLKHRIVMAPLTRFRANKAHVHGNLAVEYYSQRASVPGTLMITEATFIAAKAGGYDNVPGIYTQDQINGWKKVTDAVHAKGSFIFLQMWALGRVAPSDVLRSEDPSSDVVSSSDVPFTGVPDTPRPLTIPEIQEYIQLYATAASNAVHGAGFDGVEVHSANGYLLDQFLQDVSNKRTDKYGGSVENRSRFTLEVIEAVTKAVGAKKTGTRLAPWSTFQGMRMLDPRPTFAHVVTTLRDSFPDLAYVHVVEPRIAGTGDDPTPHPNKSLVESNDFLRDIWAPRPFISAGGYSSAEQILEVAENKGGLIAMGRYFISNPDLPAKIKLGLTWTPYDRETFYSVEDPKGYIDYPRADAVEVAGI